MVDAARHGNVARFMNHSCEPNLVVQASGRVGLQWNGYELFLHTSIQCSWTYNGVDI